MNHKQVLDKLAARFLINSLDEEISRLVFTAMAGVKNNWIEDPFNYVHTNLMIRWQCFLSKHAENESYIHKFHVALAILFHKYGFQDKGLTEVAINAIQAINKEVILVDSFINQEEEIVGFLKSKPKELKRYPNRKESTTYYRAGDVVTFEYDKKFIAAYVHGDTGVNEAPIIEFYDYIFDEKPELERLNYIKGCGQKYAVYGMKYLPDIAEQIAVIGSCITQRPNHNQQDLEKSSGLYVMSNLSDIQKILSEIVSSYQE